MTGQPFLQVLLLLVASIVVVTAARRLGLPPLLGYVFVGLGLGPFALGWVEQTELTRHLAEIGVVFLLFTLGLEFSWPRMVAMRREVFGLGALQVLLTGGLFTVVARLAGIGWLPATVLGGALAMASTAIVMRQLTEQSEVNRTHGRLSLAVLLFQDLAFVPLLALATALAEGSLDHALDAAGVLRALAVGGIALVLVLALGRWALRPLFVEIARSRLRELFTLAVLLVVLGLGYVTEVAGLSMALGGFLAGMLLAETEYRHQVEAVIRPFRELLLGLFFISVGMLLDLGVLLAQFWFISAMVAALIVGKVAMAAIAARRFVATPFKALRTGLVLGGGGEFGVALLTLMLPAQVLPAEIGQPLLVALVTSMLLTPLGIRYNRNVARFLLRERGPPGPRIDVGDAATVDVARREHVILCGFGRVGQNIARVLQSQGFEYIAIDLDLGRVRPARQAGEPVVYGDSSDEDVLVGCGLDQASAVVVSFADPAIAVGIVSAVRRLRGDVPVLVRTADDTGVESLTRAGATEVVPETFEASLMLATHVLMLLRVPVSRVVRTVGEIRSRRYASLRAVIPSEAGGDATDEDAVPAEAVATVVLPPQAWAVGLRWSDVLAHGARVRLTALRRDGITGRDPDADTMLREGDALVILGLPEELEHAEAVLLTG